MRHEHSIDDDFSIQVVRNMTFFLIIGTESQFRYGTSKVAALRAENWRIQACRASAKELNYAVRVIRTWLKSCRSSRGTGGRETVLGVLLSFGERCHCISHGAHSTSHIEVRCHHVWGLLKVRPPVGQAAH